MMRIVSISILTVIVFGFWQEKNSPPPWQEIIRPPENIIDLPRPLNHQSAHLFSNQEISTRRKTEARTSLPATKPLNSNRSEALEPNVFTELSTLTINKDSQRQALMEEPLDPDDPNAITFMSGDAYIEAQDTGEFIDPDTAIEFFPLTVYKDSKRQEDTGEFLDPDGFLEFSPLQSNL